MVFAPSSAEEHVSMSTITIGVDKEATRSYSTRSLLGNRQAARHPGALANDVAETGQRTQPGFGGLHPTKTVVHGLGRDGMNVVVRGIETGYVNAIRHGGSDANGQPALRTVAQGTSNPCRHCLGLIAEGDQMLVLAHRPFDRLQPYAESGPIFLHAAGCERYESDSLPAWFAHLQPAIIRGYDQGDWIRYETGNVVPGSELPGLCEEILSNPDVAYAHIRSKYNCFQCRVDRA